MPPRMFRVLWFLQDRGKKQNNKMGNYGFRLIPGNITEKPIKNYKIYHMHPKL